MSTRRRKRKNRFLLPVIAIILVIAMGSGVLIGTGIFSGNKSESVQPDEPETAAVETLNRSETEEEKEPSPEEIKSAFIGEIVESMSLDEKVCQMFMVSPETLTGVGQVVAARDTSRAALNKNPVGGLIFFPPNLVDRSQTQEMLGNLQQFSRESGAGIGLFLSVDEEGGKVARCAEKLGTRSFLPMYDYKDEGEEVAYSNAYDIGSDIYGVGFNLNYAPVADVWSNPSNRVIGKRAYSDDYEETAKLVAAAVNGYTDAQVLCTLKHFPGHGDTAEDSHTRTAIIRKTLEEIKTEEWKPFASGIDAGARVVMMGHLTVPEVENTPASLSSFWINDCLREELGFDGIVITDALGMQAVSDYYSTEELGVKAVQAGNDILMCISGFEKMKSGILDAVSRGIITEERIDESVYRILSVKYDMGLLGNN